MLARPHGDGRGVGHTLCDTRDTKDEAGRGIQPQARDGARVGVIGDEEITPWRQSEAARAGHVREHSARHAEEVAGERDRQRAAAREHEPPRRRPKRPQVAFKLAFVAEDERL